MDIKKVDLSNDDLKAMQATKMKSIKTLEGFSRGPMPITGPEPVSEVATEENKEEPDLNPVIVTPPKEEEKTPDPMELLSNEITQENFSRPEYIEFFDRLDFDKKLDLLGITKPQLASITDSIVMQGFYEQEVILRDKLHVFLRTRTTWSYLNAIQEVSSMPEASKNRLQIQELLAMYNCAGSLSKYGDKVFTPLVADMTETKQHEVIQERIRFIKNLPSSIYTWLSQQVVLFDLLISTATSSEGLRNF